MSSIYIQIYIHLHIYKCLKIHQLNIVKMIKNDYKKIIVKDIKVFLKKKKATKWSRKIQNSARR